MNDAASGDQIHIEQLELSAHIGVPETERARAQRLTISLTIWPARDFRDLRDDIANTVSYSTIRDEVKSFVSPRADQLIETLADAIAAHLLRVFAITRLRLELRKFVLTDARYVAVKITRERASG